MLIVGERIWWMPKWPAPLVPTFDIEGEKLTERLDGAAGELAEERVRARFGPQWSPTPHTPSASSSDRPRTGHFDIAMMLRSDAEVRRAPAGDSRAWRKDYDSPTVVDFSTRATEGRRPQSWPCPRSAGWKHRDSA